jgi:phosphate starvation-inducible membrane PsiE
MSLRIWFPLILSQMSTCGIVAMIIWSYDTKFYQILNGYSLYSSYVCVRAIINSKHESIISIIIVGMALLITQSSQLF